MRSGPTPIGSSSRWPLPTAGDAGLRPAALRTDPPDRTRAVLDHLTSTQAPLKRILLVDDDPGVREMLGRLLEAEHYEVVLAQDGDEAGAKFVAHSPDLVLLDLNMPQREGWSAFRFMTAAYPLLPVIIITARPNQYVKAEELGVDALMEKPLNFPVLLDAIRRLVLETVSQRTRRLANPQFRTAYLPRQQSTSSNG